MNKAVVANKGSFSYEARISALLDSDNLESKVDYCIVDSSMLVNITNSLNVPVCTKSPICDICNVAGEGYF